MSETGFLPRAQFGRVVEELARAGYAVMGPQIKDGAVSFGPLKDVAALPRGTGDLQAPGHYRLTAKAERTFGYACGPQGLKPLLFAAHELLWETERTAAGFAVRPPKPPREQRLAVVGPRACDLAALALHDAHFLGGPHVDTAYAARRAGLFIVAVNCVFPAATCFCASTGDGPNARQGYDLLLDELDDGFVVHAGSEAGAAILVRLGTTNTTGAHREAAATQQRAAIDAQTRRLPGRDLQTVLAARLEHPRWDEIAARCLSCGNCTAVCPTCFCNAHVEEPALDGNSSRHYRVWDSCFTEGHSYIHGIVIRAETRKRYRQWLTHKLGTWHEQYGRSGCVGCGRCITWCPVGIDITEEAAAIVGGSK